MFINNKFYTFYCAMQQKLQKYKTNIWKYITSYLFLKDISDILSGY